MAALWNPPALLAVAAVVAAGAAAYWYGLGPALRGARLRPDLTADFDDPQPVDPSAGYSSVVSIPGEQDEAWGEDDPPAPAKRPYTYPPPQPASVETSASPVHVPLAPVAPETTSPAMALPTADPTLSPTLDVSSEADSKVDRAREGESTEEAAPEEATIEDEPSLADFFRPRQPAPPRNPPEEEKTPREEG